MRIKPIRFYIFCFFIVIVPSSYSQSKKEIAAEIDQIKKNNDSLRHAVDSVIANEKFLSNQLLQIKSQLSEAEAKLKKKPTPMQLLPFTRIGTQVWATKNLGQDEVKELIPGIILADSLNDWETAKNQNNPAYCFHRYDSGHQYGVLLNIPALKLLQRKLKETSADWKIPVSSDIELMKKMLAESNFSSQNNKATVVKVLSAVKSVPQWTKPGLDLFGFGLMPLSYRINNSSQWYTEKFTNFYCYSENDPELKNNILLVELDERFPSDIQVLERDLMDGKANFGVYVRLLKN